MKTSAKDLLRNKMWREANKERVRLYHRIYYRTHKAQQKSRNRKHYLAHKSRMLEYGRKYRAKNRARIRRLHRMWWRKKYDAMSPFEKRAHSWKSNRLRRDRARKKNLIVNENPVVQARIQESIRELEEIRQKERDRQAEFAREDIRQPETGGISKRRARRYSILPREGDESREEDDEMPLLVGMPEDVPDGLCP